MKTLNYKANQRYKESKKAAESQNFVEAVALLIEAASLNKSIDFDFEVASASEHAALCAVVWAGEDVQQSAKLHAILSNQHGSEEELFVHIAAEFEGVESYLFDTREEVGFYNLLLSVLRNMTEEAKREGRSLDVNDPLIQGLFGGIVIGNGKLESIVSRIEDIAKKYKRDWRGDDPKEFEEINSLVELSKRTRDSLDSLAKAVRRNREDEIDERRRNGDWSGSDTIKSVPMGIFGDSLSFSPARVYGNVDVEFDKLVAELVQAGQFDIAAKIMINMAVTRVVRANPFKDAEINLNRIDELLQVTAVRFLGEGVREEVDSMLKTLNELEQSSLNSEEWQQFSRDCREFNRQLTNKLDKSLNTFMLDGELLAAEKPEPKRPSDKPPINLFGN